MSSEPQPHRGLYWVAARTILLTYAKYSELCPAHSVTSMLSTVLGGDSWRQLLLAELGAVLMLCQPRELAGGAVSPHCPGVPAKNADIASNLCGPSSALFSLVPRVGQVLCAGTLVN